jgi:tetratricopeptide (TPR) repeat protein
MSGDAAHGPVEAMPGLRPVVSDHEQWGEWARNIFFVVFLIELAAVLLRSSPWLRYAMIGSTIIGVIGLAALYEAAEHGGEIVYSYAGGVGTRSGNPEDVDHLFLAGLYQQTLADRAAGRFQEASRWIEQAAQRFPDNIEVQLARAESLLLDRKDPAAAVDALQVIHPQADNRPLRIRHALLTADALVATGQRDGAMAVLQQVLADGPNARVQQRLDEIKAR